MTDSVETSQRFNRRHRCPICGGCESDPRGIDKRCFGYISQDGLFARCSRLQGPLPQGPDGLWPWPLSSDPQFTTYDYRDEAGRLLFQVVRKPGKKFLQRRLKTGADISDPNGWEWTTKGTRMVLYKLPELIAEIGQSSIIFIMEGEKDVNNAWDIGLVATCNPRGAGKWRGVEKHARDLLSSSRVVVIQDNDEPGIAHARQVAASLNAAILIPPDPHKDFTDWIVGGATTNDILAAAEQAAKMPVSVVSSSNGAPASTSPPGNFGIDLVQARGQNAAIAENVARLLNQHEDWNGGPRLDTYSDRIYWPLQRPKPLPPGRDAFTKSDGVAVQGWCVEQNVYAEIGTVDHGIRAAAHRKTFDSLVEWISALPEWDGKRRLDHWLHTYFGCKDTLYYRTTGRSWLRGCVERAVLPGLLIDIVPILIGNQRANKNYAISTLFQSDRTEAPWLSIMGKFDPDRLDLKRLATTRWILHDDEFKARDPKLIDRIKSWVSMTDEQYMAKYENDLTVRQRRALLICSANDKQVLYDMTGNRRWITWEVGTIDIPALQKDRLQLFAEAKASISWRDGLDFELIEANTAQSEVVDPLRERLLRLATERRRGFDGTSLPPAWSGWVTSDALCEMIGVSPEKADQSFAVRLGRAVTGIKGWTRRTGKGAGCIRFYRPPDPISADEVRRDLSADDE